MDPQQANGWLEAADRYGVSLVMLAFVCGLLCTILWVVWRQFLLPTRERELKFVDEVAAGLVEDRATNRESLTTISKSIVAIEGYTRSMDESHNEIKQQLSQQHQLLLEHDERLKRAEQKFGQ